MKKKPDTRAIATLVAAAVLLLLSTATYLLSTPDDAPKTMTAGNQTVGTGVSEDTATDAGGQSAYQEIPQPQVLRLEKPDKCFVVNGGVYTGVKAAAFGKEPLRGVFVYSTCDKEPVIIDVKTSKQNMAFVASQLPLKTVLREPHHPENDKRDRLILFDRGGKKCNEMKVPANTCRYIAIPHRHVLMLPIHEQRYFSIRLKNGKKIEGYLAAPDGAPPLISAPIKKLGFD